MTTALICGVLGTAAFGEPQHRYRTEAPVCIHLTQREYLSGPASITLQREATRIWQRHGISLRWTQPVSASCRTVVPIVFDDDQLLKLAGGKPDNALARTVFNGRSQTIFVSVPRAFEMLTQIAAPAPGVLESVGERDYRGGILLGRIVAHELGHVLLTTLVHSTRGLMRPVFGLKDVLSDDEAMTDLSPAEASRLAMRFSLDPVDSRVARARTSLSPSPRTGRLPAHDPSR